MQTSLLLACEFWSPHGTAWVCVPLSCYGYVTFCCGGDPMGGVLRGVVIGNE